MPIKSFRPITPTLRFQTKLVNDDITTNEPHKPLLSVKQRTGGRNSSGKMTIRHQGGGHKQKLRLIDFKRDKFGIPGTVATIEYDPNRSSRIALVHYADGEKRYIIQPVGLILIDHVEENDRGVRRLAGGPVGALERAKRGGRCDSGLVESEEGFRLALVDNLEIGGGQVVHRLAAGVERRGIQMQKHRRPGRLCQKAGPG